MSELEIRPPQFREAPSVFTVLAENRVHVLGTGERATDAGLMEVSFQPAVFGEYRHVN